MVRHQSPEERQPVEPPRRQGQHRHTAAKQPEQKQRRLPQAAIIMDPPSYGRGPTGEVWKLEDNLYPFGFSTLTGRPARLICSWANSQFTACSGKRPVCLKFMGFT